MSGHLRSHGKLVAPVKAQGRSSKHRTGAVSAFGLHQRRPIRVAVSESPYPRSTACNILMLRAYVSLLSVANILLRAYVSLLSVANMLLRAYVSLSVANMLLRARAVNRRRELRPGQMRRGPRERDCVAALRETALRRGPRERDAASVREPLLLPA
jgi:hypothetical protein